MAYINSTANNKGKEQSSSFKERFSFVLLMNNNIICKRYFKIRNYIEGSMDTPAFMETFRDIKNTIHEDLASKTRIYLRYNLHNVEPLFSNHPEDFKSNGGWYDDLEISSEDLINPLAEEGENMLRLSVFDGDRLVASTEWDARVYPPEVRDNIDLSNKLAAAYENEEDNSRLMDNAYIKMKMFKGRQDLIYQIINKIYDTCSTKSKDENENQQKINEILREPLIEGCKYPTNLRSYNEKLARSYKRNSKH